MDSKYSRLQHFVNESKTDHSSTTNDRDNSERSSSSSRNLVWTNFDRLQNFLNKHSNPINDNTDDIQSLLQKGDNDPILPSLV